LGRLNELKEEIAELEAKAKAQQNPLGSAEQAAPAATDDLEQVKRVFNAILGMDQAQERHAVEDQSMGVCGACFRLQSRANTVCELCGGSAGWLVPSEARKNAESDMFIRMASDYSVEQLRIALQSGWTTTPQRERVARKLLASREARLASQHQDRQTECDPEDSPRPMDSIDLGRVATGYDRQLAEIDAKLEALNAGQQEQASAGISE
jgi:hypothetical protein